MRTRTNPERAIKMLMREAIVFRGFGDQLMQTFSPGATEAQGDGQQTAPDHGTPPNSGGALADFFGAKGRAR